MSTNIKKEARPLVPKSENRELSEWRRLSLENLGRAHGDNEPEYSLDLIKEPKPLSMKEGDVVIMPSTKHLE
jgi:hypothetical protein